MKQESSGALGSFESFFREKLPFLETPAWLGKLRDAEKDLRQEQEYYVIRRLNVGSSDFTSEEAEEVPLLSEPDSEEMLGDLFSGNPPLLVDLEREGLYVRRVDAERSPKRVSELVVTRLTSLSNVLSERLGKKIGLTERLKTTSAARRDR
ncbi:hypothetical protein AKJ64_03375 [candidate division MSBL1 archaeon SCGC-AAA259E17]|uniref:Uncharacterized protein n=1 Tax=candidate division MSBL1 archaeon SCGC-AAA259E17 TaxID=1698263 RepID=A0A133UDW4_9EURY|nr:hypothetical protein AKJ64_03375 [candidate division MSBL1 archaeon SCGC-AAA259E17]